MRWCTKNIIAVKKNILIFISLLSWPLLLLMGVHLWKQHQIEEKEAKERQEILSDTARINAAYRTYERVHKQLLMDDPDYSVLIEENEELRERMVRIKSFAEDIELGLEYFEEKGFDISDIQAALDDIYSECD